MKARLKAADIRGTVLQGHNGYVQVTVYANSPEPYTSRLLSARGNVTFKIFPKGAIYSHPSQRAIKNAKVERNPFGEEQITFTVADPGSFSDFTRLHLHERLGIYIDTRLIIAPDLMSPMGETGEIVGGNFDPRELRFIAAVLDSGPLPAAVKYISSAAIVSS
jgi:preprotein translocase subunit SecD